MTTNDVATRNRDTPGAAYEELRRRVLAGSTTGSHFGLVVLLREGVAAWMARGAVASTADRSAPTDRWAAAPMLSDEVHAGVVRVLAGMALSVRRGVSP